jgi:NADH-quinone oxidoreductase subunit J
MIADIGFYIVAFAMLVSAIWAVTAKNILHSALALIGSFFGTAILYLMLSAEFIAVAQVLVYIGGVVIFVIFIILLTSRLGDKAEIAPAMRKILAFALCSAMLGTFLHALDRAGYLVNTKTATAASDFASMRNIGLRFLDPGANGFLVPFEIISLLLLITVIGAIVIARKEGE